jgi:hypothetical protein
MAIYDTALSIEQLDRHYFVGSVPEPSGLALLAGGILAALVPCGCGLCGRSGSLC